jgi:RHS repeat-associated protein
LLEAKNSNYANWAMVAVRIEALFAKTHRLIPGSQLAASENFPKNSRTCFEGPFGELLRATGPMAKANQFRFSTKYQDDETDLLYYGYRYFNAAIGRWLGRDPMDETGGPALYAFNRNDPLETWDYLGCLVGTVKVLKNEQLPWYKQAYEFGWQIELEWRPPPERNDAGNACLPCKRAVWVQDKTHDVEYIRPWGPDVHTSWGVDWDETNYSGSALAWVAGWRSSKTSWMHDEPQVGPSYRIKNVFFMAKARVKCIEGNEKGNEYAQVTWFYLAPFGFPGLPYRATIGGILSIE